MQIDDELEKLGIAWRNSAKRPFVSDENLRAWDCLLKEWTLAADLPILVRGGKPHGQAKMHPSGRLLVSCDNSPANWALSSALRGVVPSLDDIRNQFTNHTIPLTMIHTRAELAGLEYRGVLRTYEHCLNRQGYKVAHIRGLRKHGRATWQERPMAELAEHFDRFLSPRNMFVVPLSAAGVAETEGFLRAFIDQSEPALAKVQEMPTDTAYSSSRLEFRRDVIEPLGWSDPFEVSTPFGVYRFTKAEFHALFPRIVKSASYQTHGRYHSAMLHLQAQEYRVCDRRPLSMNGGLNTVES